MIDSQPHPSYQAAATAIAADRSSTRLLTARPLVLSIAKVLFLSLSQVTLSNAYPVPWTLLAVSTAAEDTPMSPDSPTLWVYLAVAVGLVLLGGAFAGLTIALMGQVCQFGKCEKRTFEC